MSFQWLQIKSLQKMRNQTRWDGYLSICKQSSINEGFNGCGRTLGWDDFDKNWGRNLTFHNNECKDCRHLKLDQTPFHQSKSCKECNQVVTKLIKTETEKDTPNIKYIKYILENFSTKKWNNLDKKLIIFVSILVREKSKLTEINNSLNVVKVWYWCLVKK